MDSYDRPLISIIIPVYNVEKYLKECVESVLSQSYNNYEILLIDDGSTDSSWYLCDELKALDNRIKVFHKVNGGLSSARNYGIDKAQGSYIIFLDSDDYWVGNDSLRILVEEALLTDADIIRGELKEVDESGNDLNVHLIKASRISAKNKIMSSGEFLLEVVCREYFVVLYLYKRNVLQSLRFNEQQKFQEDIDFCIRLFVNNLKFSYIPLIFYAYRKRTASLTTRINIDNLKSSFHLCDVFHHYEQCTNDTKTKEQYRNSSIMMYYWTLNTLSESPYYEVSNKIIRDLNLYDLRIRTIKRIFTFKIFNRAFVFIIMPLKISTKLMRLKNFFTTKIKHNKQ